MHRVLVVLLLVVFSFFNFLPNAHADSKNYKTSYNVQYDIENSGATHATMRIGLTNQTSKYYATSYKLHIGFTDIKNIRAFDKGGSITPVLKKLDDGYSVELFFNDKVVGIGNTMQFTLSFDINSVVKNREGVWEISIPSIADQENFTDFTVDVKPPVSFGTPRIIRPKTEKNSLKFTKKELGKSGILILFGDKQVYEYNLTYHLKNNNVFPIQTEIALPPSTNYQESIVESIQPKPTNIVLDEDGNWLAQYSLSPSERKDVTVVGAVQLSLQPKQVSISKEEKKLYTEERPYWQFTPEVVALAKKPQTPKAIYDYTVNHLTYDYKRRTTTSKTRIGAKDILKNPTSAVCLEFTDLFITLARAAGIPAREVDGYAQTDNKADRPLSLIPDVLHAWPEYYDTEKQTWIMVDPTWGNTTNGHDYFTQLDLDHITFVKRGINSTYPIPAGGYKLSENGLQKDVIMSFSKDKLASPTKLSITSIFDDRSLSGFPLSGKLKVTNQGNTLTPQQPILISTKTLTPHRQKVIVEPIPPYGTRIIDIAFEKTPFLTKSEHTFTIELADKKIYDTVEVTPFLITKWHIAGGILLGISSLTLFIITRKTGRIPLFRFKR